MATTPKDYYIQLDTKYKISGESISLVQGDNNGNIFHLTLTENDDPIDLTGSTVTITMIKTDKTKIVNQCLITNATSGQCDYIVNIDALSAIGQVVYTVEVYKNNGRTTTTQAKFKVIGELDDGTGVTSQGNYNVLSTLIEEVNTTENTILASEDIRKTNENTRIVSENTRIANENTRQAQETARINEMNTLKTNLETAEVERVTEFNTLKNASENATDYAIDRANYANEQGNNAKAAATDTRTAMVNYTDVVEKSKKIYMPSVNTHDDILATYPVPQEGWIVQAKDTHIEYRYDGVEWVDIGVSDMFQGYNVWIGPTPPTNVNLLWVYISKGDGRLARILPSKDEPIDKTQIWLRLT